MTARRNQTITQVISDCYPSSNKSFGGGISKANFVKIVRAAEVQSKNFKNNVAWQEIQVKDRNGNVLQIKQDIKNKINVGK